jgi:uncharacterized protein YndB with AHSA1/START domain
MSSTRVSRHVNAPRARVYSAFVDANAIATWMVPTGMTSHVHAFEGREGGTFRISLTYDAPTGVGKTTAHTDTFHGRFVKLEPRHSSRRASVPLASLSDLTSPEVYSNEMAMPGIR